MQTKKLSVFRIAFILILAGVVAFQALNLLIKDMILHQMEWITIALGVFMGYILAFLKERLKAGRGQASTDKTTKST